MKHNRKPHFSYQAYAFTLKVTDPAINRIVYTMTRY